jgi:hypothetical protein
MQGNAGVDDAVHVMTVESQYPGEYLFVCPVDGCERRLVIKTRDAGDVVVIDSGDPTVLHRGSHGGITMSASLTPSDEVDPSQN